MPKSFSEQERKIIRQSLISIGAALMKTKNIRQITVEEITQEANISKGSFYSFYNSREELFWDIIKLQEQQLIDESVNISKQTCDMRDKIRHLFYDVFLRESWLVYSMSESDFQYIARKLPSELLKEDGERAVASIKTILSLCEIEESPENIEFVTIALQMLKLTETNFRYQSEQNRKRIQHILVEGITDSLCAKNMRRKEDSHE